VEKSPAQNGWGRRLGKGVRGGLDPALPTSISELCSLATFLSSFFEQIYDSYFCVTEMKKRYLFGV